MFSKAPSPCGDIEIMQSCNGLLLCFIKPHKYYVYNPFIYMHTKLQENPDMIGIYPFNMVGGIKLAFDPTKSPHYKGILAGSFQLLRYFEDGIYWNGAIYWLNQFCENMHFKLDIVDKPVLTKKQLSMVLDGKSLAVPEREDDSFIVMEVCAKVLQYKTALKTVYTLSDFGSDSPRESFPFISSFDVV
ncbi:hypothetical protein Tco_1442657 [Tanacetum coccineum]